MGKQTRERITIEEIAETFFFGQNRFVKGDIENNNSDHDTAT